MCPSEWVVRVALHFYAIDGKMQQNDRRRHLQMDTLINLNYKNNLKSQRESTLIRLCVSARLIDQIADEYACGTKH